MKRCIYLLVFFSLLQFRCVGQSSIFARGEWLKIAVTSKGMYRLSYELLADAGFPVDDLDPAFIQMYGNGGKQLPQSNAAPVFNQPRQNAIAVYGGDDGSFDPGDYVVFFGQSPHSLFYERADENNWNIHYSNNPYSDTTYYFITAGSEPGLRVQQRPSVPGDGTLITTSDGLFAHERDLFTIVQSGREWYGELFTSGAETEVVFPVPGLIKTSAARLTTSVIGRSTGAARLQVNINNLQTASIGLEPIVSETYSIKGSVNKKQLPLLSSTLNGSANDEVRLTLRMNGSGRANLDYILLEASQQLKWNEQTFFFRNKNSTELSNWAMGNAPGDLFIWDLSDPLKPVNQGYALSGDRLNYGTVASSGSRPREFVAFNESSLAIPERITSIDNQDVLGTTTPEMLIICPARFRSEASRLAQHKNHRNLATTVVEVEELFNEFASGTRDVTAIRNFVRTLYLRSPDRLKYLLLFGKGTFDFKNIQGNANNFVPTYESRNSLHPIYSYSSDDYFGFMEEDEGEWIENASGDHTMDIGVGRLPVKSTREATTVVDKIIHYENASLTGDWKRKVAFVADDGDRNRHQLDAEDLATFVDTNHPAFKIDKLYTDAFQQVSTSVGEVAPGLNNALNTLIDEGALIINYTGHGSEQGWAQERILDLTMVNTWDNYERLPFFVTATCEFGRHDSPVITSGGELLLLNPRGGAIGLVTTARPVFSSSNFRLNQAFYRKIFARVNNQYLTLGEIFRQTKNEALSGSVNRNFSLLGDPSVSLAYPERNIALTTVNQTDSVDTLAVNSKLTLTGKVLLPAENQLDPSFNGELEFTLYDIPVQKKTLGNGSRPMSYSARENVIAQGRVNVRRGVFTINARVPRNVQYGEGQAKLSMYAVHENNSRDAFGASAEILITGDGQYNPLDKTGPDIEVYLDDNSYQEGEMVGNNTRLLAYITDESGINVSGNGDGQDIIGILRKKGSNLRKEVILNNFFATNVDTYQAGTLNYPLNNLEPGVYSIKLQAWDNNNNLGTTETLFEVKDEVNLVVKDITLYPNPVSENEQLSVMIDHNQAGETLDCQVEIMNSTGKIVHREVKRISGSNTRIKNLTFSLRSLSLRKGLYFARISLRVQGSAKRYQQDQKLLVTK